MRNIFLYGQLFCRQSRAHTRYLRHTSPFNCLEHVRHATQKSSFRAKASRRTPAGPVILALLSPAAFVQLSEEEDESGETAEERMLEASRAEIAKVLPDDIHGFQRFRRRIYLFVDLYIIEPIATGFRFLHLVAIFVPLILAIPAVWIGPRVRERSDERRGTLWWYEFLVNSMERAGPAFIKVAQN